MTLLFLNSLGTMEVVTILGAVLVLFGAKSIPGLARGLGKGMKEIRNASNEIKRDIQNSAVEMKKDLNLEDPLADVEGVEINLEEPKSVEELEDDEAEEEEQKDKGDTQTFDINQKGEAS